MSIKQLEAHAREIEKYHNGDLQIHIYEGLNLIEFVYKEKLFGTYFINNGAFEVLNEVDHILRPL